ICFYIYYIVDHRALHSFPTRRSSDLVREYGNPDDFVGHIGGDDFVIVTIPEHANTLCLHISARYKEESTEFYHPEDLKRGSISRSEEHTSELQSPCNIVCRLLLEKKK